jgi:hypothetical protein
LGSVLEKVVSAAGVYQISHGESLHAVTFFAVPPIFSDVLGELEKRLLQQRIEFMNFARHCYLRWQQPKVGAS